MTPLAMMSGDILLKATAERLSAALRKGDTVARFGGDEFVLILPDLEAIEDAIQVAQKIVDGFRKPFVHRHPSTRRDNEYRHRRLSR